MPKIMHPTSAVRGVPQENAFIVVDDGGLKLGNATLTQFINETILTERPLNYYFSISAMDDRAFDLLIGALMGRALALRRGYPKIAARLYMPCRPNDVEMLRILQSYGFQNDDAEIRMRKIISASDRVPLPPVGCVVMPVLIEEEGDADALLARINKHMVVTKNMDWLARLQEEQMFTVLGVWQEQKLLGELIMTTYGAEGHIHFVYTQPKFRNRGIATALIAHAWDMLQQQGIRSINAEVWKRNTSALTLFQQLQFDSVSARVLYPGIDLA